MSELSPKTLHLSSGESLLVSMRASDIFCGVEGRRLIIGRVGDEKITKGDCVLLVQAEGNPSDSRVAEG